MFTVKILFFFRKIQDFHSKNRPNFQGKWSLFIVFRVIEMDNQTNYTFALVVSHTYFMVLVFQGVISMVQMEKHTYYTFALVLPRKEFVCFEQPYFGEKKRVCQCKISCSSLTRSDLCNMDGKTISFHGGEQSYSTFA